MSRFAQFGNDLYTGARSIDFIGRRRRWYLVSAVLVVLSLAGLFGRGLTLGLEFTGGSEFRVSGTSNTSTLVGARAVSDAVPGKEDAKVSQVGSSSMRIQTNQLTDVQTDEVKKKLATAYGVSENDVTASFVGPSWGKTVSKQALIALLVFLVLVSLVLGLYFRTWAFAAAAIVALLHDLVITIGIYALVGFEVTPASVIGFLTVLGYSLYDTVVVFDKVRENSINLLGSGRRTYSETANLAVNQTLVRSINTSVVSLLPIGSILFIGAFVLGAGTLKDLSLSLFIGIAVGTYSSIFIATPVLATLREREPEMRSLRQRVERRRAAEAGQEREKVTAGVRAAAGEAPREEGSAPAATRSARPTRASGPRNQPARKNRGRPTGKRR